MDYISIESKLMVTIMANEIQVGKTVSFRPSEYDAEVMRKIQARHPHITDAGGLLREGLRQWDIESTDENSKSKRLARIEDQIGRMAEDMSAMRAEISELRRLLFDALLGKKDGDNG